jgi:site-specific DNA-adenine methylase
MKQIGAIVPYFGCARMVAEEIGRALDGCTWLGVPFAGGMPELAFINCRTIAVNDLHWHVVNLGSVIAHDEMRPQLIRWLQDQAFHEAQLLRSQRMCQAMNGDRSLQDLDAAKHYFLSQWMGRSGKAGTKGEFDGGLPVRWNANGGDSNTRYRSAIRALGAFGRIMRRCNFTCLDAFEFLDKCQDVEGHGLYIDAPWPDDGDEYRFVLTNEHHRRLATRLSLYRNARVVVRFGDHPMIRELYAESKWEWQSLDGRTQANKKKAEVLLTNRRRTEGGQLF